jgi:hypothetical protein
MSNKWIRIILIGVAAVLVLCILLGAGEFVMRWSAIHSGDRPVGLFRQIFRLTRGYGAVGSITSINGQNVTLLLLDGTSQTVFVSNQTRIELNRKKLSLPDLKVGDRITVLGSPLDGGNISARLIHVVGPAESPPSRVTPRPTQGI